MNKFIEYLLNEIIVFKYGKDQKKIIVKDGKFPILGTGGIIGWTNSFLYDKPSVLIGRKGTINKPRYMDTPFWTIDTLFYTKVNELKVNPKYLYYRFKLINFLRYNEATGVPSLKVDTLNRVSIKIHENLQTQKKIAATLSALDAKIELNNKINKELENMAKLLYDYWFVQFDFPNENGQPYKSSGGKMVFNEVLKREVPEGWGVGKIADWIEKNKSGDWGKAERIGNYQLKVSCIRGADLNGLNGTGNLNSPVRYILTKNNHKLLETHDLIVEISGGSPTQSTGRLSYITKEVLERFDDPLICSNFCKAITLKKKIYLYNFVFLWRRLYDNNVLFGWEGKTSGIKNFLFENFVKNYDVILPKEELIEKFYGSI